MGDKKRQKDGRPNPEELRDLATGWDEQAARLEALGDTVIGAFDSIRWSGAAYFPASLSALGVRSKLSEMASAAREFATVLRDYADKVEEQIQREKAANIVSIVLALLGLLTIGLAFVLAPALAALSNLLASLLPAMSAAASRIVTMVLDFALGFLTYGSMQVVMEIGVRGVVSAAKGLSLELHAAEILAGVLGAGALGGLFSMRGVRAAPIRGANGATPPPVPKMPPATKASAATTVDNTGVQLNNPTQVKNAGVTNTPRVNEATPATSASDVPVVPAANRAAPVASASSAGGASRLDVGVPGGGKAVSASTQAATGHVNQPLAAPRPTTATPPNGVLRDGPGKANLDRTPPTVGTRVDASPQVSTPASNIVHQPTQPNVAVRGSAETAQGNNSISKAPAVGPTMHVTPSTGPAPVPHGPSLPPAMRPGGLPETSVLNAGNHLMPPTARPGGATYAPAIPEAFAPATTPRPARMFDDAASISSLSSVDSVGTLSSVSSLGSAAARTLGQPAPHPTTTPGPTRMFDDTASAASSAAAAAARTTGQPAPHATTPATPHAVTPATPHAPGRMPDDTPTTASTSTASSATPTRTAGQTAPHTTTPATPHAPSRMPDDTPTTATSAGTIRDKIAKLFKDPDGHPTDTGQSVSKEVHEVRAKWANRTLAEAPTSARTTEPTTTPSNTTKTAGTPAQEVRAKWAGSESERPLGEAPTSTTTPSNTTKTASTSTASSATPTRTAGQTAPHTTTPATPHAPSRMPDDTPTTATSAGTIRDKIAKLFKDPDGHPTDTGQSVSKEVREVRAKWADRPLGETPTTSSTTTTPARTTDPTTPSNTTKTGKTPAQETRDFWADRTLAKTPTPAAPNKAQKQPTEPAEPTALNSERPLGETPTTSSTTTTPARTTDPTTPSNTTKTGKTPAQETRDFWADRTLAKTPTPAAPNKAQKQPTEPAEPTALNSERPLGETPTTSSTTTTPARTTDPTTPSNTTKTGKTPAQETRDFWADRTLAKTPTPAAPNRPEHPSQHLSPATPQLGAPKPGRQLLQIGDGRADFVRVGEPSKLTGEGRRIDGSPAGPAHEQSNPGSNAAYAYVELRADGTMAPTTLSPGEKVLHSQPLSGKSQDRILGSSTENEPQKPQTSRVQDRVHGFATENGPPKAQTRTLQGRVHGFATENGPPKAQTSRVQGRVHGFAKEDGTLKPQTSTPQDRILGSSAGNGPQKPLTSSPQERILSYSAESRSWDVIPIAPAAPAAKVDRPVQMLRQNPDGTVDLLTFEKTPTLASGPPVKPRPGETSFHDLDGPGVHHGWQSRSIGPDEKFTAYQVSKPQRIGDHRFDGKIPIFQREPKALLLKDQATHQWTPLGMTKGEEALPKSWGRDPSAPPLEVGKFRFSTGPTGQGNATGDVHYRWHSPSGNPVPVKAPAMSIEIAEIGAQSRSVTISEYVGTGGKGAGILTDSLRMLPDGTLVPAKAITSEELKFDPKSGAITMDGARRTDTSAPSGGGTSGSGGGGAPDPRGGGSSGSGGGSVYSRGLSRGSATQTQTVDSTVTFVKRNDVKHLPSEPPELGRVLGSGERATASGAGTGSSAEAAAARVMSKDGVLGKPQPGQASSTEVKTADPKPSAKMADPFGRKKPILSPPPGGTDIPDGVFLTQRENVLHFSAGDVPPSPTSLQSEAGRPGVDFTFGNGVNDAQAIAILDTVRRGRIHAPAYLRANNDPIDLRLPPRDIDVAVVRYSHTDGNGNALPARSPQLWQEWANRILRDLSGNPSLVVPERAVIGTPAEQTRAAEYHFQPAATPTVRMREALIHEQSFADTLPAAYTTYKKGDVIALTTGKPPTKEQMGPHPENPGLTIKLFQKMTPAEIWALLDEIKKKITGPITVMYGVSSTKPTTPEHLEAFVRKAFAGMPDVTLRVPRSDLTTHPAGQPEQASYEFRTTNTAGPTLTPKKIDVTLRGTGTPGRGIGNETDVPDGVSWQRDGDVLHFSAGTVPPSPADLRPTSGRPGLEFNLGDGVNLVHTANILNPVGRSGSRIPGFLRNDNEPNYPYLEDDPNGGLTRSGHPKQRVVERPDIDVAVVRYSHTDGNGNALPARSPQEWQEWANTILRDLSGNPSLVVPERAVIGTPAEQTRAAEYHFQPAATPTVRMREALIHEQSFADTLPADFTTAARGDVIYVSTGRPPTEELMAPRPDNPGLTVTLGSKVDATRLNLFLQRMREANGDKPIFVEDGRPSAKPTTPEAVGAFVRKAFAGIPDVTLRVPRSNLTAPPAGQPEQASYDFHTTSTARPTLTPIEIDATLRGVGEPGRVSETRLGREMVEEGDVIYISPQMGRPPTAEALAPRPGQGRTVVVDGPVSDVPELRDFLIKLDKARTVSAVELSPGLPGIPPIILPASMFIDPPAEQSADISSELGTSNNAPMNPPEDVTTVLPDDVTSRSPQPAVVTAEGQLLDPRVPDEQLEMSQLSDSVLTGLAPDTPTAADQAADTLTAAGHPEIPEAFPTEPAAALTTTPTVPTMRLTQEMAEEGDVVYISPQDARPPTRADLAPRPGPGRTLVVDGPVSDMAELREFLIELSKSRPVSSVELTNTDLITPEVARGYTRLLADVPGNPTFSLSETTITDASAGQPAQELWQLDTSNNAPTSLPEDVTPRSLQPAVVTAEGHLLDPGVAGEQVEVSQLSGSEPTGPAADARTAADEAADILAAAGHAEIPEAFLTEPDPARRTELLIGLLDRGDAVLSALPALHTALPAATASDKAIAQMLGYAYGAAQGESLPVAKVRAAAKDLRPETKLILIDNLSLLAVADPGWRPVVENLGPLILDC
ncbi:hypothetical protein [Micromonospora sp. WMMD1219]|uniref:hypothetical protein n=1 Tax=Micromonospora sp. WMMD1219 TaxID=3404115 RepID=UPI003BF5910C